MRRSPHMNVKEHCTAHTHSALVSQTIDLGYEEQLRRIVNASNMPPATKRRTTLSVGSPLPTGDKSALLPLLQVKKWSLRCPLRILSARVCADGMDVQDEQSYSHNKR